MSDLLIDIGGAASGGAIVLGLLLHLSKRLARGVERRLRPAALRDAELIHIEKTFRTASPVPIAAKLDRAYRLPSGQLVLVELKTRRNGGPNFSDVIQLSAQRVALSAATGQTVAAEAFVLIARPGVRRSPVAHRVDLLSAGQVVALVRRREAILADRISPRYTEEVGHCRGCAFRNRCRRETAFHGRGVKRRTPETRAISHGRLGQRGAAPSAKSSLRAILLVCTVSIPSGDHDAQHRTSLPLPTHSRPRSPVDAAYMGLVLSTGPGPSLAPRQSPVRPPFGACQLNAPLMPEVLLRSDVDGQVALPLASEGVLRYVWESRYGTILIEVAGEDVFVNGQRVERHAHSVMHSAEPSASLGQNSRRENPSSMIRYGKMPYP